MATHSRSGDGFVSFFRSYTKTWIHAVATAGLTAFGTLTIFHRGFIVLALASYVVPPIVLYVRGRSDRADGESTAERDAAPAADRDGDGSTADREADGPTVDRARDVTAAGRTRDGETGPLEHASSGGGQTESSAEADASGEVVGSGETDADRASEDERTRRWRLVDVPTEATLRDVCVTESGAVHAVGEDGLVLTGDPADGDGADLEWSITLADGPAAEGDELNGVDATDGGRAVWIAGDSGSVGRLEAETGLHTDYTAPAEITDNWLGVAVGGPSGDETVLLINGSGAVLRGRYGDGECSWDEPVTPGSGSSLSGIALADASVGYCCDTNDAVFETTDGGESFDRVGLGDASGTLETPATLGLGDCLVSADDGIVHRYGGSTWTPERVGEEAICGLARREGETIACDANGAIYERPAAAGWTVVDVRVPEPLLAVSIGTAGERAVAVGEEGTVVERR
ncbi:hypothetical protein [Natrinema longum]|uniref:Uncharacterized protein n=1 Tax=Natrinema longum TaxID=370324 RepID=A0A8A2UCF4_9EURY|nr:hypothetical protein [Natrinema longum]MBZ6495792.1 hypothetical protein [Natrinema longum]QSW86264.1 hypothetical protein J0X27_05450 [Natrinema longum]